MTAARHRRVSVPKRAPRRRLSGLSLIELMISITLGLMVLSAVVMVFANASSARSEIERTSRQIENGRYAAELLSDDLRVAGFYGEIDTSGFAVPGALPDPCSVTPADWSAAIPLHLQGFDNGNLFVSANCTLTNRKANTDVLLIRRVSTCPVGGVGCDAAAGGKPYMQVSLCQTEPVDPNVAYRLDLEGGATAFDRTKKDCVTPASKRQYYVNIYYIRTDNGAGQNIPTLARLSLTGSGWATEPLVEGIEEFNLEYGLDNDGDGAPDEYVADPTNHVVAPCAGPTCPGNWANVVAVKFYLLARNLETSPGYTDPKTYTLGAASPVTVTPGGGYRRHLYNGLVRVNNPAGRRDTP